MLAAGWAEGGARTPPSLGAGGLPTRHGPGPPLTPLLGCPAPPPAHAGKCVHLDRDSFLPNAAVTFLCCSLIEGLTPS